MSNQNTDEITNEIIKSKKQGRLKRIMLFSIKFLLPLMVIVGALFFAKYQMNTRPKASRIKPLKQARLVTVETAIRTERVTKVSAMGTVAAARQVTLNPEVSGKVISVSDEVVPGGLIVEGQKLVQIDPRDYETVVKQQASFLVNAKMNLKLEKGKQTVSLKEYGMLDKVVQEQDKELVLRVPHLENAQAALEASSASLAKAKLDVERCNVKSPFNGIIQDKHVDPGARVSQSSALVTLVGTDEYWIEVLVHVDDLKWINIPKNNGSKGSAVRIYDSSAWGNDIYREGEVIRLLCGLEDNGRMAQLLVSVKNPLGIRDGGSSKPPLLIGSYVRIEIEGRKLTSVIPLKRDYLRDGNTVWIMNDKDRLTIRPVKIVFKGKDTVYVSEGIDEGDRIVTSDISAPVKGMLIRLAEKSGPGSSMNNTNMEAKNE